MTTKPLDKVELLLMCSTSPADRRFLLNAQKCMVLTLAQVKMVEYLTHKYRRSHGRCDCKECRQ